jgi:triacylglycerol esterase/lipase EstA (alpha/beta hydrolase family)
VKCKACAVANFDRLYDGAGARNALVLVPGLFADEHPFGPLIEELSYNSQPWQIWRFMYPTSLTVDEIAKQLSNSLESHAGEYDSITLIGHSLGGIIEQRALVDAKDRQLEWLAKVGKVVLVGTPNDGSPAKEIYSRLFNSLMNLDTAAKLFDINSDIIQTITQPQQMPVVEGLDYQVIAGIRSYDFTADLFAAGQKNDGVITTTSAQHIGDDYINNSCSDYYEINITHTDLNDNPVAVRVLERIINKDLASQNANKVYVGYNQYFKIAVTGCSSEDVYVLIGKKINAEKAPDPINCNCGNGWCGEGETADNCPVDCARPVTTESICLFLPIVTYIPVIIFVVLLGIAGLMRISKKKQDERSHNKSVRLKKPLAVFAAIALAISLYQYVTCKELTLISIIVNALKLPFATTTTLVIAIAAVATVLLLIFIRYFGKHAQYAIHRKEVHALKIRQQRLERLNAILDRRIQMHLEKKEEK